MTSSTSPRAGIAALAGAALAIALAALLALGAGGHGGDDVEAGFARDMSEHHAQAVDMSLITLQTSDDTNIDLVAYDIATTQANQIGQMQAWLIQWDLPMARSQERMAWMQSDMDDMSTEGMNDLSEARPGSPDYRPMPGMATNAEMKELRAADADQAEILFLQLMTTHHLAGVQMAQAAVDEAHDADVVRMAQAMVNGQRSEVRLMSDLLTERGSAPREDLSALGYT